MSYRRVTYQDRLVIRASLKKGLTKSEIADKLGFHKSTISREIKRNTGGKGYRPKQAQKKVSERDAAKHFPHKMNPILMTQIIERLEARWSPEQISNRLKLEGKPSVSPETIYKFIDQDHHYGGELWRYLRRSQRRRRKRFPSIERRGQIKDARPLSQRPKAVEKRRKVGHWERDLMLGKKGQSSVLVLTERKSRFNKFRKLDGKYAQRVTKETVYALKGLPKASLSNDRGMEFADHKSCEKKIKVNIYFCDPYSSYQRGSNENRIGVLRQYYPKKTDLKEVSNKELESVEFEINNRPMKCLDWLTPYEVMMDAS